MKDLVLYCKSYRRDFLRLKNLLVSISRYNVDKIPFYISTSKSERELLHQALGAEGYFWIADEDIVLANPRAKLTQYQAMPSSLSQQIIKSEFWRLGLAKNYLCIDSDSKFICDFKYSDFITNDGVPYTVLHQNKELFQIACNRGHNKIKRDLSVEASRVKALFDRSGPNFYCAPSPFNWSAKVWHSLDKEYLQPRGITLWDFITPERPESLIYCEALLKYQPIKLIAIEPLFRTYHYDWQYFLMKRLGETEKKMAQNYLGVIYQSTWNPDGDLGPSKKSLPSRILRFMRRLGRYMQSYI